MWVKRNRFGSAVFAAMAFCLLLTLPVLSADTVLRRAMNVLPQNLDPQKQSRTSERRVLTDLFSGLTELDQTGAIIPGAAQSWTISGDGLTYTFHLRPDSKWQDGTPLTARDFALAFARLFALGDEAQQSTIYASISGSQALAGTPLPLDPRGLADLLPSVKALDDHTLQIILEKRFPDLLFVLSRPPAFPVPTHAYLQHGENWANPDRLIGNGPYRLVAHESATAIRLGRNDHFPGAEKLIADVQYLQVPKGVTIGRYMAAGKADISAQIPSYQLQAAGNLPGYRLESQPRVSLSTVLLNMNHETLSNPQVRKALYLAVNRQSLIQTLNTHDVPAYGLVPPMDGYQAVSAPEGDEAALLAEAQHLMEEAGFGPDNPLLLTLKVPAGITSQTEAAQLKRDWAHIHVRLTIEQTAFNDLAPAIVDGRFEAARRNWIADYPGPLSFLQIYAHGFNATLYPVADPQLETFFEQADRRPTDRMALLRQAEQHLMEAYPAIPLYARTANFLIADTVSGWSGAAWATNASRWMTVTTSSP